MVEIKRQSSLEDVLNDIMANLNQYTLGGEFHDDEGNVLGNLINVPELIGSTFDVPLSKTRRLPNQPRTNFDGLPELAESLKANQDTNILLVPILTHDRSEIIFAILDGERRQRASKMIGKDSLRADFEYKESEAEMRKHALFSVLGRENLTPIEEARGLNNVLNNELQRGGITPQEIIGNIAKRAAMTTALVEQRLELLKLPEAIQDMLLNDQITLTSAQKFLNLKLTDPQVTVLIALLKRRLNEVDKVNTRGFDVLVGRAKVAGGEASIGKGAESGSNIRRGQIENRISTVRDRIGEIMSDVAMHPELRGVLRPSIERLLTSVRELARAAGVDRSVIPADLDEKHPVQTPTVPASPVLQTDIIPPAARATASRTKKDRSAETSKAVAPPVFSTKKVKLPEYISENDELIRSVLAPHQYAAFKLIAIEPMTMPELMRTVASTHSMDFIKSRLTFAQDLNDTFAKHGLRIKVVNVGDEYWVAYAPEHR